MFGRSGAPVEFLSDWQIGDALLRVIAEAKQRLALVSPYNKHWGHLKREVAAARQRGVAVTIYYRADEPGPPDDYDGVTATPVRMLHAKIYANESVTLLTTMNLLETSAMYSREVGLLIKDAGLRREIDDYIKSLGEAPADTPSSRPLPGIAEFNKASGLCIECGTPKDFDPDKPLCLPCYNRHGRNGTHQLCHRCGQAHPSQLNEPLCQPCREARPPAPV